MKNYKLILKYVYTFYNFGEIISEDIFDEEFDVKPTPARFILHDQEDGSFILSEILEDKIGRFVIVTFPNKDVIVVRENEVTELVYDEYYSAMGDDNHNVYIGTLSLVEK